MYVAHAVLWQVVVGSLKKVSIFSKFLCISGSTAKIISGFTAAIVKLYCHFEKSRLPGSKTLLFHRNPADKAVLSPEYENTDLLLRFDVEKVH